MKSYGTEFEFFKKLLNSFHLTYTVLVPGSEELPEISEGIYRVLNPEKSGLESFWNRAERYEGNVIYRILTPYEYRYLLLRLPEAEEPEFLLIGPYMLSGSEMPQNLSYRIAEHLSLSPEYYKRLELFYMRIPRLDNESVLLTIVNVFGERIWGGLNNFCIRDENSELFPDFDLADVETIREKNEEPTQTMRILEERYEDENLMLQAVARGQTHRAEAYLNGSPMQYTERRASERLRNAQNYLVIFNTLLRKAVESADVHPVHIDEISSRFAKKIEGMTSEKEIDSMYREMVRKYCLLVTNHSMKNYSLLIRKALTQIDIDLTADLSLKGLAETMDVNASYLSALFKKETGKTLTEYVNGKRIEHAVFLLNSTKLQVQEVARRCGIDDVNYFTKLFKKIVGKTPKEYRNSILKD